MSREDHEALLRERQVPPELWELFSVNGLGSMVEHMGIVFGELTPERATGRFPAELNLQLAGVVHGGAHVALAETLGSCAASLHGMGDGKIAMGVDINATHTRACSTGWVHGECTALHLGRSLCVHEIVMTDDDGRRLSTARITNTLVPMKR